MPQREPQRRGGPWPADARLHRREPRRWPYGLGSRRPPDRDGRRPDRSGDLMRQPTAERPFDDKDWLRAHLEDERKEADLLAEVREVVFGLQDGVTSILAVVS